LILSVLLGAAFAAGVAVAPADGVAATGPARPAWAILGAPPPARGEFSALSGELDRAWAERRALDNAAARRRVDTLVEALRPTLDAGARDLLQRALFLRGVLDVDDAGGLASLKDGATVGSQRIPQAWLDAIAVSPGAPAPSTADAAFATHVYDEARTTLAEAGGLTLDPSAPGAGDVRVDGLPVTQPITLLAGPHTLSWHPVGADPVVLQLAVGGRGTGYDASRLAEWLSALVRVQAGEEPLTSDTRGQLHAALGSPAAMLNTDEPARLVWLVDGPARWGKPRLGAALGVGAWAYAGGEAVAVSCDGLPADATPAFAVGGLEASVTLGRWRVRAGVGVQQALGTGFAAVGEGSCAGGVAPAVELVETLPWGWASVGPRIGLSRTRELEPFLRVGGTGAHAVAQVGANVRLAGGGVGVELRVAGGPAVNFWSDDDPHLALAAGLETLVTLGGR
jgi:hypothetical protein